MEQVQGLAVSSEVQADGQPNSDQQQLPLCGQKDGATHILLGCEHKEVKALYIKRHNVAVQLVWKCLMMGGTLGGSYCVMDATSKDELPQGVDDNRLKEWILPEVDCETRRKMRPDIMFIQGVNPNGFRFGASDEAAKKPAQGAHHRAWLLWGWP